MEKIKKLPQIIQLPKILDDRGNLSFLENDTQIPFAIKRVHWIYDVPGGEARGGVAYRRTSEVEYKTILEMRSKKAYKIGNTILKPLKKIFNR